MSLSQDDLEKLLASLDSDRERAGDVRLSAEEEEALERRHFVDDEFFEEMVRRALI